MCTVGSPLEGVEHLEKAVALRKGAGTAEGRASVGSALLNLGSVLLHIGVDGGDEDNGDGGGGGDGEAAEGGGAEGVGRVGDFFRLKHHRRARSCYKEALATAEKYRQFEVQRTALIALCGLENDCIYADAGAAAAAAAAAAAGGAGGAGGGDDFTAAAAEAAAEAAGDAVATGPAAAAYQLKLVALMQSKNRIIPSTCSVCLCDLVLGDAAASQVSILNCLHMFHSTCFRSAHSAATAHGDDMQCPECRTPVIMR